MRINGNSVKIDWQSHKVPPHLAHWHLPKHSCVVGTGDARVAAAGLGLPTQPCSSPHRLQKRKGRASSVITILCLIKALHVLWHKTN